ncbi:ATP-binding protein [Pleionea sp. CnH1-48]|uniref:ATP-binding protein n=1 Tax=Pleionea sp. CnH1-48 TaxID=2954494 RepID=UPI0020977F89|nr:ATP-binding protein [Pleionea sp. CnH1-48]MCO7223764.1 ATP-binding protein [Pleionea sp. CnH1-48]
MITAVSFQTRARTIDHLGREQIADCPTAISELWKNAYDAYARNVSLNIFDGVSPVATLVDDGHGMNVFDIESKWLVVGTESKAVSQEVSIEDMNGIETKRVKQGQKGIGRLSCAALGSLLLLVSKKKKEKFSACLLDWRLFENPHLMLGDVQLPINEFETRAELLELMPSMFDMLMGNIWGGAEKTDRDKRVEDAWELFHQQELESGKESSTKELIENTVIEEAFSERHIESWSVWSGKSNCGTAMIIGNLNDDLKAQLSSDSASELDGPEKRAKESFNQTLSSFVNPLTRENESCVADFNYSVVAYNGSMQRKIIDNAKSFSISDFDQLEHAIEGSVNEEGLFYGKVKSFGKWFNNITIRPKVRYKTRKDSRFGPFSIRVGTFEREKGRTSLSDELFAKFGEQVKELSGFMVHRDNLRVMPYGRENNDFFEIEKRRTLNAGRYVFSNRGMFGGICINKESNPNLKDKAGREGLIDNRASKLLKEIVENILIEVADRFIGRNSEIRKDNLDTIQRKREEEKANENRRKLLRKEQRRIRSSIKENSPKLSVLLDELVELESSLKSRLSLESQNEIVELRHKVTFLSGQLKELSLSPIPSSLGNVESAYRDYRKLELQALSCSKDIKETLDLALESLIVKEDIDIAESEFRSKAGILHGVIKKYAAEGRKLLNRELSRFDEEVSIANKSFHRELSDYLDDLAAGRMKLSKVTRKINDEYEKHYLRVVQQFRPYVSALKSIGDNIDLEGVAIYSSNENRALKKEVERLHSLAQLGITVEIIGHEIEGLDVTIESGLKNLSGTNLEPQQKKYLNTVILAHQSLSNSWRFLSTLKLSGEKVKVDITGEDIFNYVVDYFSDRLKSNGIELSCSESFRSLHLFDLPSRIYPVFINLVNNSRYWVKHTEERERLIKLDYINEKVIVGDNGPGVHPEDIQNLFTIFFTRKQRGGRGVGLYLCRMNLQAGGHSIYYEEDKNNKILNGANFVILFEGICSDK